MNAVKFSAWTEFHQIPRTTKTDLVDAFIERTCKEMTSFRGIFETGIMWQLERKPLDDAVEIPGASELFLLQTTAWAAEGIPPLGIVFCKTDHGIQIVRLAFYQKPAR